MNYLVLRTGHQKELYVCGQLIMDGYKAWVPIEFHAVSITRHTKTRRKAITERNMCPKTVFAAIPVALQADLHKIRYYDHLERNADGAPIQIPENQIKQFRDYIDAHNSRVMAWAAVARGKGQKPKPLTLKLDPGNMQAVMEALFGQEREAA